MSRRAPKIKEQFYFQSEQQKQPAASVASTQPDYLNFKPQKHHLAKQQYQQYINTQQSIIETQENPRSRIKTQEESSQALPQVESYQQQQWLNEEIYDGEDKEYTRNKSRKQNSKQRKIRTTVTKERLQKMNQIFLEYFISKEKGKQPKLNLKEIAVTLNLGYSTILHKFRQFRNHREVKGGALLQSLQKKRKYKKSYQIERCIQNSLKIRSFTTAVELSHFIKHTYNKQFSRSIISRHLASMGYSFNNVKYHTQVKNDPKHIQTRYRYANFIQSLVSQGAHPNSIFYIDQFAFSKKLFIRHAGNFNWSLDDRFIQTQQDYVTLLVAMNHQKMFYYDVVEGFYTRTGFCKALGHLKRRIVDYQRAYNFQFQPIILTDMNKIHIDSQLCGIQPKKQQVSDTLSALDLKRFFLPPYSPQLNPLQTFFDTLTQRIPKSAAMSQKQLKKKIENAMKQIYIEPTKVYFKSLEEYMSKAAKGQPLQ